MKPLSLSLASLLLLPQVARGQEPFPIDALQSVSSDVGSDPQWLPDGRIVFVNGRDGALSAVDPATGTITRLDPSGGPRGAAHPRLSPDGKYIVYQKALPGSPWQANQPQGGIGPTDLFVWSLADRTERRLTKLAALIHSFSISADSRSVALSTNRHGSEDIFVVDLATGATRRITSEPLVESMPSWTPDGTILYTRLDDDWMDHAVLEIAPTGGAPKLVLQDKDFFDYGAGLKFGFPRVSPDGKSVLFRSQRTGWFNVWIAPIGGGAARQVAPEPADQVEARWSPDGKQILFLSLTNGAQSLKTVPAAGGAIKTLVDPGMGMVTRAEWAPDSRRISYALGTPTTAPDLYVVDAAGGAPKQLTFSEGNKLAGQLVVPEKISWTNEGFTIPAYLWKPKNLRAGERAPVIMLVHGGPTSQFSDNFTLHPQWLASRGYVVIAPNVRGSSGYGRKFEDANNRDWGHGDLRDVLAGVAWAKRQSYVDPEKIGITGNSYGGMMTLYAIAFAPSVFQAAVSQSGYGDVIAFQTRVPVLHHRKLANYELGKWPSTPAVNAVYKRSSSILKVKDVTTPTFIIHGAGLHVLDADYAGYEFAKELEGAGKLVRYKAYPNETYYVYGRENTKELLQDMVAFFDTYLRDGVSGTGGITPAPIR
ncbi:MAG: alpha/beta fold hydrolase [Gemmatimonadales bacterium]|nr:alpha/beta fold hydrolase [Gemmatimonadales bacterium]